MEATRVTHAVGGDDMLGRLMDAWRATTPERRPALGALVRGGIGDFGGRVDAVIDWAETELGATFCGVYGSSELFALTSIWPVAVPPAERRRGGGTVVSDGISVRAVDPHSGARCPAGTTGELQFRGYNVVCGYLGNADELRRAVTHDGWFRSGDLGFVLEAPTAPASGSDRSSSSRSDRRPSFVYICRAGDALRLRGFLVEPAEIERFLCSHAGVAAAKVVGVPSAEGADTAVAFVQLTAGATATADELIRFCRDQLAPFKVPAMVNVIEEFPVTAGTNGTKIRTGELRRWAEERLGHAAPH
jgi:fatty-acyl-CoA synthase